jgi:23S rRNA (cytidine2498-2'-O)-methyltransferase
MARTDYPAAGTSSEGLFIIEAGDTIFCSRNATFYGQKRMKNDMDAPSRSFLKIEEAFSVFAAMPVAGDVVVDLGAAPGGWSYAASKRGAQVMAIDNGPLKKGAAGNPNIRHYREDAFKWLPSQPVDWLFCDMVEEPSIVLTLIKKWLNLKLFRCAIINFKCGHASPDDILRLVRGATGISSRVQTCICRHLYHDRNEFTVMLKV